MQFDPYAEENTIDPYPAYAWLREHDPVHHNPDLDVWFLTRYADVHAALQDPGTFSSSRYLFLNQNPDDIVRNMQSMDPPRHDSYRQMLRDAFTSKRVAALEPMMRTLLRRLMDGFEGREEVDLSNELCWPYPATVIFEMLGVPEADRAPFHGWAHDMAEHGNVGIGLEATRSVSSYFDALVAERIERPQDDLISAMITARAEDGTRMTPEEVSAACYLVMTAGHETTTHLLGNALALLAERPRLWSWLRERPERIPVAVEEFLRFVSPAQGLSRTTTRDARVGDETIPEGSAVHILFASANRDEAVFERADELDLARQPNRHLAFGFGVHFCLGAKLARLEAKVAFEELLAGLPAFELACDRVPRTRSPLIRGLAALPVRLLRDAA
jgi:cytochrome P450